MSKSLKTLTLASLLWSSAVLALPASNDSAAAWPADPGFSAGGQYTATLDQTRNQWRLQPADGQDVTIDTGRCATGAMVPAGLWLLVSDGHGRAELVAPSVTRLPAGSAQRIALRPCDKAQGSELAVPQVLLDLLAANTGAVYVRN
ncbi:MAG: hypothetical protein ABIW30_03495 [Arenimonas sp.]